MIYAATVVSPGVLNPLAYIVLPAYTRTDGLDAIQIEALPISGLYPLPGDVVFCAEGINDFFQTPQALINDNGGAFPLIFGTLASPLLLKTDMQLLGKMTLGLGLFKMVIGDNAAAWAKGVDASLAALYTWAATGLPPGGGGTGGIVPFPGTPAPVPWVDATNLSQNHTLD